MAYNKRATVTIYLNWPRVSYIVICVIQIGRCHSENKADYTDSVL